MFSPLERRVPVGERGTLRLPFCVISNLTRFRPAEPFVADSNASLFLIYRFLPRMETPLDVLSRAASLVHDDEKRKFKCYILTPPARSRPGVKDGYLPPFSADC